eukprot:1143883-Pelagomonas_calceolata.AAC.10
MRLKRAICFPVTTRTFPKAREGMPKRMHSAPSNNPFYTGLWDICFARDHASVKRNKANRKSNRCSESGSAEPETNKCAHPVKGQRKKLMRQKSKGCFMANISNAHWSCKAHSNMFSKLSKYSKARPYSHPHSHTNTQICRAHNSTVSATPLAAGRVPHTQSHEHLGAIQDEASTVQRITQGSLCNNPRS